MNQPQLQTSKILDFVEQLNLDQKRYSRYVCDSRAIPNVIDGLKPVQRRILWTMWNTSARNQFTKTVKVAGMTMGYHPHGDASIQDAISQMTQDFTFANNYPLISGEGTFGDVLDPKAIASPRYTEVKISDFAKQVGLFDSLPDIDYIDNYDETAKEPVFFVPKIPLILINHAMGIATGFRCNILARNLLEVIAEMIKYLKGEPASELLPWYKGFLGKSENTKNEKGKVVFITSFGFKKVQSSYYLIAAPQGWNREKTIQYLETLMKENNDFKDYTDHSKDTFFIELIFKRGMEITVKQLQNLFKKQNAEVEMLNTIDHTGKLRGMTASEVIALFCDYRRKHLLRRFIRLAKLEEEKIAKQTELIRFIKEKWNITVLKIKNRSNFISDLKAAGFVFYEWLVDIPVYRLTLEEVQKCQNVIVESKKMLTYYRTLSTQKKK